MQNPSGYLRTRYLTCLEQWLTAEEHSDTMALGSGLRAMKFRAIRKCREEIARRAPVLPDSKYRVPRGWTLVEGGVS